MSSESKMPPPVEGESEEKEESPVVARSVQLEEEVAQQEEMHPYLKFSPLRWASTGIVRLLYRYWTRIAVALFPENSAGEQLAKRLRIPLPDELNLSWVTPHLAVGGRVHPDDIASLARIGVTQVVDTRSEYSDDA